MNMHKHSDNRILLSFKERSMIADDLWQGGEHFFLFTTFYGKPLYPDVPRKWFKRFTEKNNMKYIRVHDFRHTSATILINEGEHAKIISARLGHADIKTTMNIYGHVMESADHSAASKFDNLFSLQTKAKVL